MEQQEYTKVTSRSGRFNFARPEEISVSTHIAVYAPDDKKKMFCNIRTDHELESDLPVEYLIAEIDTHLKRVIYSSEIDEIKAIREYLKENESRLTIGNLQREKIQLQSKIAEMNDRVAAIDRNLSFCEAVAVEANGRKR